MARSSASAACVLRRSFFILWRMAKYVLSEGARLAVFIDATTSRCPVRNSRRRRFDARRFLLTNSHTRSSIAPVPPNVAEIVELLIPKKLIRSNDRFCGDVAALRHHPCRIIIVLGVGVAGRRQKSRYASSALGAFRPRRSIVTGLVFSFNGSSERLIVMLGS